MTLERWLHDLGYTFGEINRLTMLEIDRLIYAERLRQLFMEGFDFSHIRAVERYRRKNRNGDGS